MRSFYSILHPVSTKLRCFYSLSRRLQILPFSSVHSCSQHRCLSTQEAITISQRRHSWSTLRPKMADSDDEDLKKAIALSLQKNTPKQVFIDLISDDEDDNLDAPLSTNNVSPGPPRQNVGEASNMARLSIIDSQKQPQWESARQNAPNSPKSQAIGRSTQTENVPIETVSPAKSGLLAFDRKKMEKERLARVDQKRKRNEESTTGMNESRKRVATASPGPSQAMSDHPNFSSIFGVNSNLGIETARNQDRLIAPGAATAKDDKRLKSELSHRYTQPDKSKALQSSSSSARANNSKGAQRVLSYQELRQTDDKTGIQFPNGVLKKTWAYGCPRTGDDIKIEEVLQKETLDMAVLSAFQFDMDWLLSKIHQKTKITWVVQAKGEGERQNILATADKNFRFCFPSMEGQINCMHSKLQLLAHPTHLRIVIPSANLVPYDWGESGVMENICFLIDLPRLPDNQLSDDSKLTEFAKSLLYFVTKMGLDPSIIKSMEKFDYSHTEDLAFVHSIGGSHSGAQWKRTGYCGLATAIQSLGLATEEALDIDFVAASIGNLNDGFIQALYLAAQGDNGLTEYGWRTNKPARSKVVGETERRLSDDLKSRCRIYYPTRDTVAASKGGIGAAGTICFQPRWYDDHNFPRHLMRDCESQRGGLLMHSKMWFVRPHQEGSRAWAYAGSANLSESAWGRLVKDKSTKEPKLNCRNWECGVIFPVPTTASEVEVPPRSSSSPQLTDAKTSMKAFQGYVPVPMTVPGEEYGKRRPWFYNES